MNPVLALGLVAAAGIAITYLPWLRGGRFPRANLLIPTGAPLVLLGVLLGPGIGVLEPAVLATLAPVTALAIGWIGAVFGSHFEWRLVRRIPRAGWNIVLAQAAAVFGLVALAAWLFARWRPELAAAWTPSLPAILTLAAAATVSGPAAVALVARGAGARPTLANAIGLAAALDTAFGVLGFTVALALLHPHQPALGVALAWGVWLLQAVAGGILTGALFLWLARAEPGSDSGLWLLGTLLLGAGVGYAADLSPFVVCAIAAGFMVTLSPQRRRVQQALRAWEPPIYAILLIIAGALLRLPTPWLLVAAAVLAALRVLGRWAPVRWTRGFLGAASLPRDGGLASVAQGAIAVALGVDFYLAQRGGAAGSVVTTVVLGMVCARLAAPPLMARALALRSPPAAPPSPAVPAPLPEPG
jgi:hypothetical protein